MAAGIFKGSTPVLKFQVPSSVDLDEADAVSVVLSQALNGVLLKYDDESEEMEYDEGIVLVYLSEADTLKLDAGENVVAQLSVEVDGKVIRGREHSVSVFPTNVGAMLEDTPDDEEVEDGEELVNDFSEYTEPYIRESTYTDFAVVGITGIPGITFYDLEGNPLVEEDDSEEIDLGIEEGEDE